MELRHSKELNINLYTTLILNHGAIISEFLFHICVMILLDPQDLQKNKNKELLYNQISKVHLNLVCISVS